MKRMTEALILAVLSVAAIAAAAAKRSTATVQGGIPICYPDDVWVHATGWPEYDICGDSAGYHTCWRPTAHTGRHNEWDLSTGKVHAVWPCPK